MPKCENCYHKKVCINGANYKNAENCKQYKPESLIVKLPCRIGDAVYYTPPGTGGINELTVVAIHLSDEKLVRKKLHKSHFVAIESSSKLSARYNLDSFGKTVFLTREEAERALEEREKNGKV